MYLQVLHVTQAAENVLYKNAYNYEIARLTIMSTITTLLTLR